nr:unnamed protein product [Digitaria exilis]
MHTASALRSSTSINTQPAASSPEIVELTLLAGAREKGAVCLDGSPPGYHLQRGFGSGAHSWLVYLQGGGWCNTTESCSERKRTEFGSSKLMEAVEFTGILSNRHQENPDFHNWNIVVIRYCDGASFAGDAEGEDLDLSGQWSLRSLINGIVHLQNVREALPKSCLANKDPTECFFPAELIKSISTPTFILNSDYDSWQILILCAAGFRKKLVSELKVAEDKRDWGLFIDSCFTHCQTPFRISWISRISPRLHNKTIAAAVGDWYFGREKVKYIDCEYPCNPTCSSRLPTA